MLASLGSRVVPPDVLAALRTIDKAAQLVHLGGREWLLGVERPNLAAKQKVEAQLKAITEGRVGGIDHLDKLRVQNELGKEFQLLQLCAQGFRPIHLYDVDDSLGFGHVIEDFRLRDHNWRTRPEAAFRELRDEISFDVQDAKRTEIVREAMDQEGGSLFRHVFKKAKSFLFN